MMTIFSIPKPFRGHNGVIQRNAIKSWTKLFPLCEIILLGDDEGTTEISAELGLRHAPEIERSDFGTPLISSMFNIAQQLASHELICYVNADIILMSDFMLRVKQIREKRYLLVGQRCDLDVTELIDFTQPDWETCLHRRVKESGKLHAKSGIDYFVFPRGLFGNIPGFAVGRAVWDNWLIYRTRKLKAPVIDATQVITAIHQNHDYSHIKQQSGSHQVAGAVYNPKGLERERNIRLAGGINCAFTLEYATLILDERGLKVARTPRHLYFRLRAIPALHPNLRLLLMFFKAFERCLRIARYLVNRLRT